MASLYELSAGYASLLDAYDSADTDEERNAFLEMLTDTEGNITEKAEQYARIIKNKAADAKALRAEAKRLTDMASAAENVVERMKKAMLECMKLTDTPEIKTSIGKWRVQTNPMSCDVTDPDKVPERFHIKQPDKIDKAAMIREHKETGEVFDGAEFKQEQGVRFR